MSPRPSVGVVLSLVVVAALAPAAPATAAAGGLSRERIIEARGSAGNQAIWFTDARPNGPQTTPLADAFKAIDQWLANIREHPGSTVAQNRPDAAADRCFTTDGHLIAAGPHVWDGILDHRPQGECTKLFPIHSTSRVVAGGPFDEDMYKCHLKPVGRSIVGGDYGRWHPDAAQRARLRQIFPTGVCDYSKPPVGRPATGLTR